MWKINDQRDRRYQWCQGRVAVLRHLQNNACLALCQSADCDKPLRKNYRADKEKLKNFYTAYLQEKSRIRAKSQPAVFHLTLQIRPVSFKRK